MTGNSEIVDFYDGATVFLTGASGFLGKVVLAKMLKDCGPRRVYVLMRTKRDKTPERRLEEMFSGPAFENLHREKPDLKERITIVEGDLRLPGLGMSEEDKRIIVEETQIVHHWAATVRFNENLKAATEMNVRAVRDLLDWAKQMKRLKAFLYVSTAYSNCIRTHIEETVYDVPMSGKQLIDCMESMSESLAEKVTPAFLDEWPNSYVYTKAAAEDLIKSERGDLPVVIFRPSIVVGSYKEPVPGWNDSLIGITGFLIVTALGILRIHKGRLDSLVDIVPADYVANAAIAATVEAGRRSKSEDVYVVNCVSSAQNPLSFRRLKQLSEKHGPEAASTRCVWHYFLFITTSDLVYRCGWFLLHTLPAMIADGVLLCLGKKPMLVKGYAKIAKLIGVLQYFGTRDWRFENGNTQKLWEGLNVNDRQLFDFDVGSLDWNEFWKVYTIGCRTYVLKDPIETIPQGKRHLLKLKVLHYIFVAFLLFLPYRLATFVFGCLF